jgi:predicted AlkP superfamily phosphohydrolase/phosphomutase
MPLEEFGPQTRAGLAWMRRRLLEATEQQGALGAALLAREAWDLFLFVFGPPHRGGHYLWDSSQVEGRGQPDGDGGVRALEGALREVYRACDVALGRLLERAPPQARVLVFALHGMGRHPGWVDYCPAILLRIENPRGGQATRAGLMHRLDRALPRRLIRRVTTCMPPALQDRLVTCWHGSMLDSHSSRVLPLGMDVAGFIRVNLRGRERHGLVAPGEEYAAVCREVKEAFLSFRDLRTEKPIVERVYHVDELAPAEAPYRDRLPDLVITWSEDSAIDSPGVRSEEYGELRWSRPSRLPSGRSGNHRAKGWFVAAGEGIPAGARADGHGLVDLAPTVCRWLGVEPRGDFQGRAIPALSAGVRA